MPTSIAFIALIAFFTQRFRAASSTLAKLYSQKRREEKRRDKPSPPPCHHQIHDTRYPYELATVQPTSTWATISKAISTGCRVNLAVHQSGGAPTVSDSGPHRRRTQPGAAPVVTAPAAQPPTDATRSVSLAGAAPGPHQPCPLATSSNLSSVLHQLRWHPTHRRPPAASGSKPPRVPSSPCRQLRPSPAARNRCGVDHDGTGFPARLPVGVEPFRAADRHAPASAHRT